MLTVRDFFVLLFSCLQSLVDSACFLPACLLFSILLMFASSLKHYYCPLFFAIGSSHDVRLHVTPALPTAFLKKKCCDYTVNLLYQEASRKRINSLVPPGLILVCI